MDDPFKLAHMYHEKMNEAYQNSQVAWKEGRKADAKKFSDEMKQYKEKMNEYKEKANELREKKKKEDDNKLTETVETIISKELNIIEKEAEDIENLKVLYEDYVSKMKSNYEKSQNCFKSGLKAEAKQLAEIGKAYKILVQISNETLKELKKNKSLINKELSQMELREIIFNQVSDLNNENLNEIGEERNYAKYFADEMIKHYNLAQIAWKNNDKEAARNHSELGSNFKEYMDYFNKQAAKTAFVKNNNDIYSNNELDLHGLTVSEATCILDEKVKQCINEKVQLLKVIVGKGLHSGEKGPKLKNLVVEYAEEKRLEYMIDPSNEGCIFYLL